MPVIDHFEGDMALWEGGCAPRALLPPDTREGDVVQEDGAGGYVVDRAETEKRRAALAARLSALFKTQDE